MTDEVPVAPPGAHPAVVALARSTREAHPRFRLVVKEQSRFMRLLYFAGVMVLWNRSFMTSFTTTIGSTVYMPRSILESDAGARVLRHERVHLDQFRRHPVWFPLSYLFVLPFGVTMRARWELEAYAETMRAELEETGTISDATVASIERRFTGPTYLFMDIRRARVRTRLEAARDRLLAERPPPAQPDGL